MAPASDCPQDETQTQFSKAQELLTKLIGLPQIREAFRHEDDANARRVYTAAPTLWLLILQRLGGGLTLEAAVAKLRKHHTDILPPNRRVLEGKLSENSSGYHRARQRILLETVEEFSHRICDHLSNRSEPVLEGRRVFILDGTTIKFAPTSELQTAFPPAKNKRSQSVWPVASLLVAHEMQTGCALLPQVDPMYGKNNSSEAAQARRIIERLPANSLVLADSNFGIFSVAYRCRQEKKDFVLRLTKQRFRSLRKKAELIEEGRGFRSYQLAWSPTAKDLASTAEASRGSLLHVVIHQLDLDNGQTLELVSSSAFDAATVGQLYLRRYDVEFDIRDLKVTMDTENIRAKSVEMVTKELMTSVIAYNLVMQFRKQAAKLVRLEPRRLSFSGVWLSFQTHLLGKDENLSYEQWLSAYQEALISASNRRLPNRKKPRSYPRLAHPRAQKSTKFAKALRNKRNTESESPPT